MDLYLSAAAELFEPFRLLMLAIGVVVGLVLGVIPGLGGIFGMALLLPLTYSLDPYAALALLLGLGSVTTTSDTIPAVFLGVPGTVGSMATVLDGHPLAQKNQAARALGAAYTSSIIGGVFGAVVLALALPIMRPLMLFLDFGDFLALSIFGLTIVALLAGSEPFKGLMAAILGILVSYIGLDPHEGVERWTFGQLYLWEGLPTSIVFLGLFGLPELAALLSRGRVQLSGTLIEAGGTKQGLFEALREWRLVLKNSAIGAGLGAMPGVGLSVIDWIAYGAVSRKPRSGEPPFGEGNIRGVIAPESANNAKEGGALIPTIAFGVPGSSSMSLLLGAFMIQGIEPGPSILNDHASLLITMIFSVALANILGGALCLGLTRHLARLAVVPAQILVPLALTFILIAAFNVNKSSMDFMLLLVFGLLGVLMWHLNWPRAAFALGFVLGPNLERFFFLEYQISGWGWLLQPTVLVLLGLSIVNIVRQVRAYRKARVDPVGPIHTQLDFCFAAILVAVGIYVFGTALSYSFAAGVFPLIAAGAMLFSGAIVIWQKRDMTRGVISASVLTTLQADLQFLLAPVFLAALIFLVGHLLAPLLFLLAWGIWVHGDQIGRVFVRSILASGAIYLVFDGLISQPWPSTALERLLGF